MSFGVTPQGFIRKDFSIVLGEMQREARERFGESIDISIYSPLGILLELQSFELSKQWEELEKLYYNSFLDTAEGIQLDRIVALGSLARQEPLASEVEIEFQGDAETIVTQGTQVSNESDSIYFETTEEVNITQVGSIQVRSVCTQFGTIGNVLENTLTKLVNPISGVDSINNPLPALGGRNRETDNELISRHKNTGYSSGNSLSGIRSEVGLVEGVRSVVVYANETNVTNQDLIPPRSIHAIVDGGDNLDIANAIYQTKTSTVETYGDISVTIKDIAGEDQIISFSRPSFVAVEIKYLLSINERYEASIQNILRDQALEYIEGVVPGEPLQKWKLIAAQDTLRGLDNVVVEITRLDTNQKITENKLQVRRSEKVTTTLNNILVEVV